MNCNPCEIKPAIHVTPGIQKVEKAKKMLTPDNKAFLQLLAKAFVKSILS